MIIVKKITRHLFYHTEFKQGLTECPLEYLKKYVNRRRYYIQVTYPVRDELMTQSPNNL